MNKQVRPTGPDVAAEVENALKELSWNKYANP
jgi:hypothetical protein